MFELVVGHPPFEDPHHSDSLTASNILRQPLLPATMPSVLSAPCRDFIAKVRTAGRKVGRHVMMWV